MSDPVGKHDPIWTQGELFLDRLELLAREEGGLDATYEKAVDGVADVTEALHVKLWATEDDREFFCLHSPRLTVRAASDDASAAVDPSTLHVARPIQRFARSLPEVTFSLSFTFHAPPEPSRAEAVKELADAVLEIVSRQYLQNELLRFAKQVDQQHLNDDRMMQLYAGITLQESFAAIASVLAEQLGVERVSILQACKNRYRLVATSTQAVVDRRAQQARLLEQLVAETLAGTDSFRLAASESEKDQVETSTTLQRYLLSSAAHSIAIRSVRSKISSNVVVAAIVTENFSSDRPELSVVKNIAVDHAIDLAIRRNSIGLSQLTWNSVSSRIASLSTSRKFLTTLAVVVALAAMLVFVRVPLNILASGRIEASTTQNIFAPTDAMVDAVLISNGQTVSAGEPLVRLRSAKLDLLSEQIKGDLATARTELSVTEASRSAASPSAANRPASPTSLAGTQQLLQTRIDGLTEQLAIVEQQRQTLTIRSPIDGQVDRWDLDQTLRQRPVTHGEYLLAVVAPADGWKVQLDIPEVDSGYVIEANSKKPVACTYRLASSSDQEYSAALAALSNTTMIAHDGRSVLRGTLDLRTLDLPSTGSNSPAGFRVGATVNATIHCGQRSLGFVWFRSLIQWARQQSWW